MKRLIAFLCLIGAVASAQLPVHHNSVTSDVSKIKGNYDTFNWKWLGFNSQSNNIYVKNGASWVDMDGLNLAYKISRNTSTGVVTYVSSTNITITDSNAYFAVANTNVPSNGTYLFELFSWTGSTNPTASLAQGKITVNQSLYQEGDGLFPWPSATNLLGYLTIASAEATYVSNVINGGTSGTTGVISRSGADVTVTFPAAAGETNHASLINLDYASAGHTGFQPTISGTVITNGANISDLTNDSAYITDADIAGNSTVASNTAKVSYSDLGNVALLNSYNNFTGASNTFAGRVYLGTNATQDYIDAVAGYLVFQSRNSAGYVGIANDSAEVLLQMYGSGNALTNQMHLSATGGIYLDSPSYLSVTATNGTAVVNYQTATNLIATLNPQGFISASTATNISQDAFSVAYEVFTASGTATVSRSFSGTNYQEFLLICTNETVLTIDTSTFPTNGGSVLAWTLNPNGQVLSVDSTTIDTNSWNALTLTTNAYNDLIFRKAPYATVFKVAGE